MDYQTPAQGILVQKDFGSSKLYQISCDCGDVDHDLILEVESDDGLVSVRHYVKVQTDWWARPTQFYWLNSIVHRVKLTWNIWVRGYLEYEAVTYMTKQQAFNYAYTLNQAVKDVEQFQETSKQQ